MIALGALVTLAITSVALAALLKPPFLSQIFSKKAAIITTGLAGATTLALTILFGCSLRKRVKVISVEERRNTIATAALARHGQTSNLQVSESDAPPAVVEAPVPQVQEATAGQDLENLDPHIERQALIAEETNAFANLILEEIVKDGSRLTVRESLAEKWAKLAQERQERSAAEKVELEAEQKAQQEREAVATRTAEDARKAELTRQRTERLAALGNLMQPAALSQPPIQEEAVSSARDDLRKLCLQAHENPRPITTATPPQTVVVELAPRAWPGYERIQPTLENLEELIAIHQSFNQNFLAQERAVQNLSPTFSEGENPKVLSNQVHTFQVELDQLIRTWIGKARTTDQLEMISAFQDAQISRYNHELQDIIATNDFGKRTPQLAVPIALPEIDLQREHADFCDAMLTRISKALPLRPNLPDAVAQEVRERIAQMKTRSELLTSVIGYCDALSLSCEEIERLQVIHQNTGRLFGDDAQAALLAIATALPDLVVNESQIFTPLEVAEKACVSTLFQAAQAERIHVREDDEDVQVAQIQIQQKLGICLTGLYDVCQAFDVYSSLTAGIMAKADAAETLGRKLPDLEDAQEPRIFKLYRAILGQKITALIAYVGQHNLVVGEVNWPEYGKASADRIDIANRIICLKLGDTALGTSLDTPIKRENAVEQDEQLAMQFRHQQQAEEARQAAATQALIQQLMAQGNQ